MSSARRAKKLFLVTLAVLIATGLGFAGLRWKQSQAIPLIDLLRQDQNRAKPIEFRPVALGGVERSAIVTAASQTFSARDVPISTEARLQFSIGIDESVWDLPGDGVLFRVQARTAGKESLIFSRYVDAKKNLRDRRWIDVDIPIAEKLRLHASEISSVDLIFSTGPGYRGDRKHDFAVWADIQIAPPHLFYWLRQEPMRPPNVLLLSVDTLRADHVGAFGYERATTSAIDGLAAQGFKFHRAHAPANHTMESHMSALTGLYATSHGVRRVPGKRGHHGVVPLPKGRLTLPEMLQAHGYVTAGFVYNCLWLGPRFGFDQGFDLYHERKYPAAQMNDADIFPWLDTHDSDPFFLFVHYYDVHSDWESLPYDAPQEFRSRFVAEDAAQLEPCDGKECATQRLIKLNRTRDRVDADQLDYLRSLYDAGIAATDQEIGRLIDKLRALGILDNTLVVVMADHGEEFREHGRFIHSQHYQEILRVPLIFRFPHKIEAGGESDRPVSLVDVAPTVLDMLGLHFDDPVQGRSLVPLLRGDELPEKPTLFFGPTTDGIIDWPWKMIHMRRRTELYNLEQDPLETIDLASRELQRVAQLQTLLEAERSGVPQRAGKVEMPRPLAEPSESELERLRALGYLE